MAAGSTPRRTGRLEAREAELKVVTAGGKRERIGALGTGRGFLHGAGGEIPGAHFDSGDDGAGGVGDGAAEGNGVGGGGEKRGGAGKEQEQDLDGAIKRTKRVHCEGLRRVAVCC